MHKAIVNIFTVALLSAGALVNNFLVAALVGEKFSPRFDYLALAASFVGILLLRESFPDQDNHPNSEGKHVLFFSFLGIVIAVAGMALMSAWAIRSSASGGLTTASTTRLELASSLLFVAGIIVLLLRDAPESVIKPLLRTDYLVYDVLLFAAMLVGPAALMTYVLFRVFLYDDTAPNHASVFGGCIAAVVAIVEGYSRAKRKREP